MYANGSKSLARRHSVSSYSPDLNSIEKAWAKLKQPLHWAKAGTKEVLDQSVEEVLKLISPDNAEIHFETTVKQETPQYHTYVNGARIEH